MGDFNYVAHKRDRFSKVDANWSDNEDATEERRFCRILRDPFGFCELEQEEYTHDSARGRSRLDRIYSNHHLTDQLDRRIGCAALAWVRQLSAHRPVAFFRQHSAHGNVDNRVPAAPMKDPRWSQRVALRYGELRRSDASEDQPIRRLLLIKQAIRDVCKKMDNEQTEREAVSTDDKLGWAMRYIRAAEELRFGALRKCVQAYPHLISLAHPDDPNSRLGTGLQAVRQHAIELARTAVADDIHKLYRDRQQLDEMQRTVRRDSIQLRLKRLVPGAASALNAVCTADGSITTEPVAMADALRSHWGPTFAARAVDGDMLTAWLQEVYPDGGSGYAVSGLPCPTSDAWRVDRESIEKAVTISSDSMPSPDGIPYVAWRCLGPLGIDILLDAASTLASPDGPRLMQNANGSSSDDHEFNLGILCCLPKKASGNDPTVGDYHAAENTRPLSIVNTDNRLIANAYRLKWEPVFNTWISQYQQGFLQGRSMLSNVVDVDFEAMTVSLQHAQGAVILFDFKAAFPSISHRYLFRVLQHIGLPEHAMRLVESLYDKNRCVIACGGSSFSGFPMHAGIRQGCPLSPLLFAAVVDLLLRRLASMFPGELLRAFADDTAMVVKDWWAISTSLASVFTKFGAISGVDLNIPKTVIIPLWPTQLESFRSRLYPIGKILMSPLGAST